MNKQEIFDKVVQHARTQKKQAIERGMCKYRTQDGLKCFIGCLIPDDKYNPYIEGSLNHHVIHAIGIPNDQRIQENITFLLSLQTIHDQKSPFLWEEELQFLAEVYELTYNPPDNKS